MRHDKLISILVLAMAWMAGCSASDDDVERLDSPGERELPRSIGNALTDEPDPDLSGGGYGVLLFDTTSSMNTVRSSTGNTRCYDGKIMARGMINDFFNPTRINGDGLAIWGFTNNPHASDDVQPTLVGYYTDSPSAVAAVNGLSCAGNAPLADALCKGVNGDGETFTISPMLDQLFIVTDGIENNSNGVCAGSSGSIATPGTWQNKVFQQMLATGIRVDVRYWVNPTALASPDSIDAFAAAADEPFDPSLEELQIVADIEGLSPAKLDQLMADSAASAADVPVDQAGGVVAAECDVTCQELALFEAIAVQSGGTWGVVTDDDAQYPIEDTTDPATGPVHPTQAPPPVEVPVEVEVG